MQMLRTSSDPLASVWRFLPCFFLVFHSQIGMMISSWRIFLAGFSKNKQPIDRLLIGRLLCHGWIWTDLFFYFKMFGWHELFVLCWNKQSMGWKRTLHKAVKCWAVRTSVRGLSIRISHPTNLRFRFRSLNIGRNQFQSSSFCFFPPC